MKPCRGGSRKHGLGRGLGREGGSRRQGRDAEPPSLPKAKGAENVEEGWEWERSFPLPADKGIWGA